MKYNVTEIAKDVWCISEGMVQCFLIAGSENALLFDCCMSGGTEFKEAVCKLTSKPIELLISHSDGDHTGGQEYFLPATIHPAEMSRYQAEGNTLAGIKAAWENDRYALGGVELEVILIPGHTPGSIVLLDRDNRRLFCGDTISDSQVFMFGEGRSLPAFVESLKRLESIAPLVDTVHSAHGSPVISSEWISKTREAAELLQAGKLAATDPPMQLPCKLYSHSGVNLLYV